MERAASFSEFARRPVGRCLAGAHWLAFCRSPTFWGFALWGRVEAEEVPPLIEALRLELVPGVPPHVSLVDTTRLTGADAAGFAVFQRYVANTREQLARQVTALALVRPSGFEGAVVAGFYDVLERPYPVALVTDVAAGLSRLGVADGTFPAALARAIDDAAGSPLIGAVRALLRHAPRASLAEAARQLGLSARTLQRRLTEQQTSYTTLQAEARLAHALERITMSASPFTAIAIDAGYSSTQHLSTAVKRATGKTPTELRRAGAG
ncbi:MAG: helix-turn-helix transcriptional regulator [Deltaproteobacteria bacterium]|nr:helix-turn-helix transcriptional regulator [Deltaproteobacteria bacterium]